MDFQLQVGPRVAGDAEYCTAQRGRNDREPGMFRSWPSRAWPPTIGHRVLLWEGAIYA